MSGSNLVENAFLEEAGGRPFGDLFHHAAFFRLHAGGNDRFFEWVDAGRTRGAIHFGQTDAGTWRSPVRGTYAGYHLARDLPLQDALRFHDAVEERLGELGAKRVEILPPPLAHDPDAISRQLYTLRSRGFTISRCDLNQSQSVGDAEMAMSRGNRRSIAKSRVLGYRAERLPPHYLPDAYQTIVENRSARGYPMSMSLAQLEQMRAAFPDRLVLFGCRIDEDALAGAAICLRLSPSKLYVFYWGEHPDHTRHSPVVLLAETIHTYCRTEHISLLDVGTSTLDVEPNHGLLRFKAGLGFETSLKIRLEKHL